MGWQALLVASLGLIPSVSASASAFASGRGCGKGAPERPSQPTTPGPDARPRLVLLLTIDQARGDYLDRFGPALGGGLSLLRERGVAFTEAHQRHALTVTAAGHASLSTGLFPGHSGMVGNDWYDRTEGGEVYCVGDADSLLLAPADGRRGWRPGAGRSPRRLLGTGLGDWVKTGVPGAKVYSVGGKDRSAVLMGGKDPDGAFWYDTRSGQWISSRHYYDAYPSWVEAFHRLRHADRYFGTLWTPLPVEDAALDGMEISGEAAFPKSLGRAALVPDTGFYSGLYESPFVESYLLEFAERLVVEEKLGLDEATDVLALSFSSVDSVGHDYGPNSREVLDTFMRLDRELSEFFRFLDETVGMSRVAIVLSADHGVAPLPGKDESRWEAERAACFQQVGRKFEARFGSDDWFVAPLHFDYGTLERNDVSRQEAEAFLATDLAACPSVARTWTRTEVEGAASSSESESESESAWATGPGIGGGTGQRDGPTTLQLYRHSYHADRSPDVYIQLDEFRVPSRAGTTHGSPYRYDTHVSTAVLWPGVAAGRIDDAINTVDLPVTIAALLGIAVPSGLDGVDRSALIRGRRSPSTR